MKRFRPNQGPIAGLILWSLLTAGNAAAQTAGGLTADALLAHLDHNETSTSAHVVGTITVEDRLGKKVTGFESWSLGDSKSLVSFTSGEEKGQKILRLKDTLYVAYPEADKPVKIQGAALKDSVAGSDFSYEDMAGDRSLVSRYTAKILGEDSVAGDACAVLELRARKPGLAYPMMKVWVSLADFSTRKGEKYSQNERLLKTEEVLETTKTGGRVVASKIVMTDALKARSKTVFEVTRVELDIKIDAAKFSLEELTW